MTNVVVVIGAGSSAKLVQTASGLHVRPGSQCNYLTLSAEQDNVMDIWTTETSRTTLCISSAFHSRYSDASPDIPATRVR
jgi:hypothetical protein